MTATAFVKRPENAFCRIIADTSLIRADMHISKKEKNRCNALASFEAPNKIQPRDRLKTFKPSAVVTTIVVTTAILKTL